MAGSLEERVERLERLLEQGGQGDRQPTAEGSGGQGSVVEAWLRRPRKPGETISGALVQIGSHMFEHVTTWDAEEEVGPDRDGLRRIAAIGEALSSDVRLAILQRLLGGSKTTAQLVESVPIDRSQLYHHVRDLFVHGLVEQPERGRYEATARGKMALLLAAHLGAVGPETLRETAELDLGE